MNSPKLPELNPEELALRLDEALAAHLPATSGLDSDDARLDIALTLANARHPEMSPEMLARIQSKVVATHQQQHSGQRTFRPQVTHALRWAAAVALVLFFFGAGAMPAVASSVPGELWYPFKRSLENVELLIASSPIMLAEVHLTQAERRINEVQVLLQRQTFDANLIRDAQYSLTRFDQAARQQGTPLPREDERSRWVNESIAVLLQQAGEMDILSDAEVIALLPTASATATDSPSVTPTMTVPTLTPTPPALVIVATIEPTPTIETMPTLEVVPTETQTLTPTITITPTVEATPSPTVTNTLTPVAITMYGVENANLREQPGRSYPIIAVIKQGDAVAVIGEDATESWWQVRLEDGTSGWVAKFLLSVNRFAPAVSANSVEETNIDNRNEEMNTDNNNTDFGCENPGNFCNAPGQTGTQLTPSSGNSQGNPGGGQPSNPGGGPPSNPGGGQPSNPGGGPPSNPGGGNRP